MKKTRFILSVLLVLATVISIVPISANADDTTTTPQPTATSDASLPENFSLVGTTHLPPISNQGAIGSCASQSITYMQMTNAVSRYIHSIDPDSKWNPSSGESKYLMSPKFTYDYSGSGTAWVYDILVDHGCATMDYCAFETGSDGGYKAWKSLAAKIPYLNSTKWTVGKGEMLKALNYRLKNYDQVWVRNIDAHDAEGNFCLTTTETGKEFLNRIKQALVEGNVVVTGGISGGWKYDKLKRASGSAKFGEWALTYTEAGGAGGHQLAIVGYDDNVIYDFPGGTLKGAFLVANSWAESWMNKGYVWVMYDALNTKSENEAFNKLHPNRTYTMDQYIFTYWDKDIEIGLPSVMAEVELECVNRENVAIYLSRSDEAGTSLKTPKIFYYGKIGKNYHPKYDITEGFDFNGNVVKSSTKKKTAYFTLQYSDLLTSIPEGKSFNDYTWGLNIYSLGYETVVIKSIKLLNSLGEVISSIDIPEEGIEFKGTKNIDSKQFRFEYASPSITIEQNNAFNLEYTSEIPEYLGVGKEISFKVSANEGKQIDGVFVNGTKLESVDGIYTAKLSENNTIRVETSDIKPEETELPETTSPATNDDNNEENSGGNAVLFVIIGVVAVAVIAGIVIIGSKKKSDKTK